VRRQRRESERLRGERQIGLQWAACNAPTLSSNSLVVQPYTSIASNSGGLRSEKDGSMDATFRWLVPLFGLFFMAAGVALFNMGGEAMREALGSSGWPVTSGVLDLTRVDRETDRKGKQFYRPVVQYSYMIDGKRFRSTRVSFGDVSTPQEADARAAIAKYTPGTAIKVHVNPAASGSSVIQPGIHSEIPLLLPGFGLLFGSAGLFFFITGLYAAGRGGKT
jgi:hypothetical protein